jgi:acyl-CoA dehydrogenase
METMTLTSSTATSDLSIDGLDPEQLAALAESDAQHDRDGTYVADCIETLRAAGWLSLAVPTELGGQGATIRDMAARLRALARHAPNTALVTSMHTHVALSTAWRFRRGLQPSEALLRRIADENIFVVSTGGNDFLAPSGEARAVDGGFVVSARKQFCSGALSGAVFNTGTMLADSPEPEAIHFGLPASADGVRIEETWDSLGMRGTGSHDVVFDEVFVPEASVAARRPLGVIAPLLQVVSVHAFPVVMAVYLGVAEGARDRAVELLLGRSSVAAGAQRLVGEADQLLVTADWALRGMLDDIGDHPDPTDALFVRTMLGKKAIADSARTAVDRLMDALGGMSYSRRFPIERAWRDVRAAPFHPLTGEQTLMSAGALALGQPLL